MDEVGTNGSAISEQKMETTTVYLVLYWLYLVILSRFEGKCEGAPGQSWTNHGRCAGHVIDSTTLAGVTHLQGERGMKLNWGEKGTTASK